MAEANVNMIANEDAPAPPDYIMDSYDKYGIIGMGNFLSMF
jgi:exo-1,4-beta-D-glucosaminidase